MILGLDFASITGYAVMRSDSHVVSSGTWDIRPRMGEAQGMRYKRLRNKLRTIHEAVPGISLAIYELAHLRGRAATEQAIGCQTVLQEFCAEFEIDVADVRSGTLKKFATGYGEAGKDRMVAEVRRRWGLATRDDNEADAILVAEYGRVVTLGLKEKVTA